jgi:CRP-like cAMP-binding protein
MANPLKQSNQIRTISLEQLKEFVPINSLDSERLQELVRHANVITLPKGSRLFTAGDNDNRILYLLHGEIELRAAGEIITILSTNEEARLPLDAHQPRKYTAITTQETDVIVIERNLLDILLTWDPYSGYHVDEIDEPSLDQDWMVTLLQSKIFQKIPPINIQIMFQKLNPVSMQAGEIVFYEGEPGDDYYLIRSGECDVIKFSSENTLEVVSTLKPGQGFGEEALLTNSHRNATIRMRSDGMLLKLNREEFDSLFKVPVIRAIDFITAQAMEAHGAIWIDTRQLEEHQKENIPDSLHIPLNAVREYMSILDPEETYILYCDTGQRSACAAYILNAYGYDAYVLEDGLLSVPEDTLDS